MFRKIFSGLFCVVLAFNNVTPMEMRVLASEMQMQESCENIDEDVNESTGENAENTGGGI